MEIIIAPVDGACVWKPLENIPHKGKKAHDYIIGFGGFRDSQCYLDNLIPFLNHEVMHIILRKLRLFRANKMLDNIEYFDIEKGCVVYDMKGLK